MVGLGRLRPGVDDEGAQNELTGIWQQAHRPFFPPDAYRSALTPLSDTIFGPTRAAMLGLLGAVVLVLVMACANVAGAAARAGDQTPVGRRCSAGPGREPQASGARGPCRDVVARTRRGASAVSSLPSRPHR
jgi:hypothetical protein